MRELLVANAPAVETQINRTSFDELVPWFPRFMNKARNDVTPMAGFETQPTVARLARDAPMSNITSPYTLHLRRTFPEDAARDHFWTVVDHRDNQIGSIDYHAHLREGMPRWAWAVGFRLRRSWGEATSGWEHPRDRSMIHLKGSWLKRLEVMTDDDHEAAVREQRRILH